MSDTQLTQEEINSVAKTITGAPPVGPFHDSDGNMSSKRISAISCLILAAGIAVFGVISGKDTLQYVITFLSAAGAFQGLTVLQGK